MNMQIEEALQNMYENITIVISKVFHVGTSSQKRKILKIILETSSGQGSELLTKIPDIGSFYKRFSSQQRKHIRFCIDTCHIFAAGYDIRTEEGVKEFLLLWEKHIGLENIILIHLNDSEMPLGSNRDRHAAIGSGYITNKKLDGSMDGIKYIVNFANKMNIPMILERGSKNTKAEITKVKKLIVSPSKTKEVK
jgi:deoxyribonuclease-4